MIAPADFYGALERQGLTLFTGVPDSLLKDLCAFITERVPPADHVIHANEGSAVALAIGWHLATGKIPVVYLQNSGTGNAVNPLLSLADPDVYAIPILFVIGWRGEPGVKDEPQHVTQGRVQPELMRAMGLPFDVIGPDTSDYEEILRRAVEHMRETGRPHALLVRKGTFAAHAAARDAAPALPLTREEALGAILGALADDDVVVSTTGMASREVFEYRAARKEGHHRDFLTVGAMGHCSQIALGVAAKKPERQVFCLDGDGAVLMHMGSLAIVGTQRPANFKHVVINNGAHDSVGGQPTAGFAVDFRAIALACGYTSAEAAKTREEVAAAVARLREARGPALLEVRVRKGARPDLGRPTTSPAENKRAFMKALGDGDA